MDDRLIAQVNATANSLREAATAADEELRAEQRERDAIDARIEQLQGLKQQLEEAIAQAEGTASGTSATARKKAAKKRSAKKSTRKKTAKKTGRKKSARKRTSPRSGAGRQDAVLEVLSRTDGPVRPAQVAEQLRTSGRDDTSSQVSAALAQLTRSGRATKAGQGLYQKATSG